jgi:hypothetical protein
MRYTTTDGPNKTLNAIRYGAQGAKMGIAATICSALFSTMDPLCHSKDHRYERQLNKGEYP